MKRIKLLFPQFIKAKSRNKLNALWLTMSSDCLLLFLLTVFAWESEATVFIMWSTRGTHIPGRVSKNCFSLSCLRYWGLMGSFCHSKDLRREVGLALPFHQHGLTIHPRGGCKTQAAWFSTDSHTLALTPGLTCEWSNHLHHVGVQSLLPHIFLDW